MQKSDTITKLAAALVQAQPLVKTALMDCTNPFFKSKYADLGSVWDAVREALQANGLAVTQLPDAINGAPALTTMLIHESGDWIAATYPLVVTSKDETAQGYGSAVTYARRYGLSSLMGVIADTDDDGNAASKAPRPSVGQSKQPVGPAYVPEQPTVSEKTQPAPTITVAAWLQKGINRVPTLDRKGLDEFSEKYHEKIAKARIVEPDLHGKLIKAIKDRQAELF